MFKGRKITDPVVQGAAVVGYDSTKQPGLSKVWDTVGEVRCELRKVEQHLDDAERHRVPGHLNQTGETSITDYGGLGKNLEHNETYLTDEYASGAIVDNHGRSAYLKSKTQAARKISRLDNKYVEENSDKVSKQKKSVSRKQENYVGLGCKNKQAQIQLQEKKYDSLNQREQILKGAGDRQVEFSDHVHLHHNHFGLGNGHMDRNYEMQSGDQSTLTNSRDIRDTEIHFLNNDLTRDLDSRQFQEPATYLNHVSVLVHGSSKLKSCSLGFSSAGTQKTESSKKLNCLDWILENSDSDASQSESESSRARKFKGDIRHIDPDGLAKIKETIRKQQSKVTIEPRADKNENHIGAIGGGDQLELLGPPQHHFHNSNEPILVHSTDVNEGSEKTARVRKIAAGPATPSYKGFSEAEAKYRQTENKGPKAQDATRKNKKPSPISVKVQDKRVEPVVAWLAVDEVDVKTKKVSRVVAPTHKQPPKPQQCHPPSKNKAEVITTSSWRAGQELIMRELGPLKKRLGKNKDNLHSDKQFDDCKSPIEDRPEVQGRDDYSGLALSAEIQYHKALSEQARSVYKDLILCKDESDKRIHSEKEKHWKAPVKRKAPKNSDMEKQLQPISKQRHYDQEQVRRFMQRQKADRLRQKKEEEMRIKEEEEARKRQLEELYNKQKQASHVPSVPAKKEKNRCQQTTDLLQNASIGDLPKHYLFHTDRPRFMVGSDCENKETFNEDHNMSVSESSSISSSSTITGNGSSGDNSRTTMTPRHAKIDVDIPINTRPAMNSKDLLKTVKPKPFDNDAAELRTLNSFTFNTDNVMSKFSQALQEKLNEEPRSLVIGGSYNSDNRCNSDMDRLTSDPNRYNDGLTRSRADRLQAIKDTATTLQYRLKKEAKKIQLQAATTKNEYGATISRPTVRWNDNSSGNAVAKNDFTVFKSILPGTQNQHLDIGMHPSVHKAKLPSGSTNNDIREETMMSDTSTFSEISITDESDIEGIADRKFGTGLRRIDFHIGSLTSSDKPSSQQSVFPILTHSTSAKASNCWDVPIHPTSAKASNSWDDPDESNLFGVYSRRLVRPGREPMSKKKLETSLSEPEIHQYSPTQASANSSIPKVATNYSNNTLPVSNSWSPGMGIRQIDYQRSEPLDPQTAVDRSSEDKASIRIKSTSDKLVQSNRSLPVTVRTLSKPSDTTSEVDSSMDEDTSQDEVTPRTERLKTCDTESASILRHSPSSLERKLFTEFHNLESMELSLQQLTSIDKIGGHTMAQQETVSLAQILKAKHQGYDQQMKEIQLKAQIEASEAAKQLEGARKRASEAAINAADVISKVRGERVSAIPESTRKLIDTQTEAAKATAEAAKFLLEARTYGQHDANKLATEAASSSTAASAMNSGSKKWLNATLMMPSKQAFSEEAMDLDDLESIGSIDDFSINDSMTEDEREEKSFRLILPSESHRKKGKHLHSDSESVTSEASSTKILDHDFQSLFRNETFDKFTEEMVQQFMKEEDKRAKHQASLLHLRESALLEKTKAELQWLEQQKQRPRNKGADDSYPQIKKRQRGLQMKLQEDIRRLREENFIAAKERQRKLYEEITKRQAAQNMDKGNAIDATASKGRLGRPNEVHTEAEVSSIDESSDAEKQQKEYKSDSEIYADPKSVTRKAKQDSKNLETYKRTHLDEKYLTQRQSRLMDRRKNAEELLKWKKMLDAEEDRVFKLEKKALKVWEHKDKDVKKENSLKSQTLSMKDETDTVFKSTTMKTIVGQDHDGCIISEHILNVCDSTAHEDSLYSIIKEDIKSASGDSSSEDVHRRMIIDTSNLKVHDHSGSESSVMSIEPSSMEDIPSSVEESKKTNDSSDDTMTHSFSNDICDDTAMGTTVLKKASNTQLTPKSPLEKLKKMKTHLSPRSPKHLFSKQRLSRNSESESEDSISHTESQSELSDFEGRIRALNEELRRRKTEADKLKREKKKKKREMMKSKEESLKKQIEAYDSQINQLKVELEKEMSHHEPQKTTVRPQIKQPKVSPPKIFASKINEAVTPPTKTSTYTTDIREPEFTQVSPNAQDDKDEAPKTSSTADKSGKVSLENISEGSESMTSHSDKSELTDKECLPSIRDLVFIDTSMIEEIEADISAASEPSEEKSPVIKIDLSKATGNISDIAISYPKDFMSDHALGVVDKLPESARSLVSKTETIIAQNESTRSHLSDHFEPEDVSYSYQSEQISEHLLENCQMLSADSEPFVKQINVKEPEENETDICINNRFEPDDENTDDRSISLVESSRPSSVRSDRSIPSYQMEHETFESEKSLGYIHDNVEEQSVEKLDEKKTQTGLVSANVFDINYLLGIPDEDVTPVASLRGLPFELPGAESERSRTFNIIDPLSEFNIGDRVSVTGPNHDRVTGTLLFKGNVQFANGIWAGVELSKPMGRHNGMEDGVRYFTCRSNHGLIVPSHDIFPEIEDTQLQNHSESFETVDVRTSIESVESGSSNDDLMKFISEADSNVQLFDFMPEPSPRSPERSTVPVRSRNEFIADKITDHLLELFLKENLNLMSVIAQNQLNKKGTNSPVEKHPEIEQMDIIQSIGQESMELHGGNVTEGIAVVLAADMVDAKVLDKVLHINVQDQSRDSGTFEDVEDVHQLASASPTDEIERVLDNKDDKIQPVNTPIRPGSPIVGLEYPEGSHKPAGSGMFEGEFDDEPWMTRDKGAESFSANGTKSSTPRLERKVLAEEVFYAVPHDKKEICDIVAAAVDEFWEQRRYGEPLTGLRPSEAFYTTEEIGSDLISNSRRVFKQLLFDLTGEVIRNIYKEDYDSPITWHKPKRKSSKFYKGSAPPTTVDVLKPVVQGAVIDILGLNGAKNGGERNKWSLRKKKDLVDTIVVQELQEEEQDWINYDDDELAVKMQLTETIFENLLMDTVQMMNKIFKRKQAILQQLLPAV